MRALATARGVNPLRALRRSFSWAAARIAGSPLPWEEAPALPNQAATASRAVSPAPGGAVASPARGLNLTPQPPSSPPPAFLHTQLSSMYGMYNARRVPSAPMQARALDGAGGGGGVTTGDLAATIAEALPAVNAAAGRAHVAVAV
jgi:hypothetical protein